MKKHARVAIIGTGTAALAAAKEVRRYTEDFVIVSNGVYGTTCVRTGCMPSKTFIQATQVYHLRHHMQECGVKGTSSLYLDPAALMDYVRSMREHFLQHAIKQTSAFKDHIVEGMAVFRTPWEIQLNDTVYNVERTVLATGSSPILPENSEELGDRLITTNTVFERRTLPSSITVMGLSVLGTEMAQAFARIGIKVTAIHDSRFVGGLTDPWINEYALNVLRQEMDIRLNENAQVSMEKAQETEDALFVAMSRKANLDNMRLEELGVIGMDEPIISYNPQTMQVGELPVFVAGDVKLGRSILNESVDEGRIAGYNAAHDDILHFKRRTPLQIIYTDPAIAIAGKAWDELDPNMVAIGEARFDDQGRAKIMGQAKGILHIYGSRETGELLGAELFAPEGEYLAHMLAWLIDSRIKVWDALQLPFYHPTLVEGLKTALHDLAEKCQPSLH
jgi:dihydrolipoamide dehydrogenase